MSSVIGADHLRVEEALRAFAVAREGELTPFAGPMQMGCLVLTDGPSGVTAMYPPRFYQWDKASAFLSRQLGVPAFSFHIHDGDFWMFTLFADGQVVTRFNAMPHYFDPEEDAASWRGDPQVVARLVPGVSAENIENYLVQWDFDYTALGKAYPDDEFKYGDCWQLCDFMKRLGLNYPVDHRGKVTGTIYRFHVVDRRGPP